MVTDLLNCDLLLREDSSDDEAEVSPNDEADRVPRRSEENQDWSVLWEHMEHYAPIMYQGTKPKKSSKSAPKVGDMFLMPKGKVDGESSEEDQFTLWMGQILEINQNSVVVQWWSCDRFLGEYYPLIDATTVITYQTQHVHYLLRDKNVLYCSLLFIRRCM